MNRIEKKFKELKSGKRKAFIGFITAGDPSLKATEELAVAFEKVGVDIVELGVPFSDPLADGPIIQASYERSLKNGTTLLKILETVSAIRKRSSIPIALMASYNPIFHFGEEKFIEKAKRAGVDGVIIPDLPPEEAHALIKAAKKHQVATIFFLSPTTTKERVKKIASASTGFIYYISLTGVTGLRQNLSLDISKQIKQAKRITSKPICVGFGVSTQTQVRDVVRVSDGVIVGSAIVAEIFENKGKVNLIEHMAQFVSLLTEAAHQK